MKRTSKTTFRLFGLPIMSKETQSVDMENCITFSKDAIGEFSSLLCHTLQNGIKSDVNIIGTIKATGLIEGADITANPNNNLKN